jgi:hypothetical protein
MVTEGNHEVRAVAAKQKRGGPEGTVIVLYISSKESQMGWKDTGGEGSSMPMDYPPFLVRGATLVADTTLALNTSPASRVEVLQGPEDVARLQEEGLSPKELRYAWRTIAIVDFSKSLLITFFDELRPGPGCLPFLEGPDLVMQEDVFKGGYRTFCLPGSSSKLTRSVSSVEIVEVGRLVHWIPQSGPVSERPLQKRPLDGITTLEFTINDGDLVRYTVDIRSVGVETK